MIKLSDYVFKYLKETEHVKDAFLLPGGGCMHLVDSLGNSGINYVCCLIEQAAGIAASGYSQYVNDLGVALVTTGPGGTNAVTPVAGAWTDSIPLLVLSGQVKTADLSSRVGTRTLGFQEIDIVSIVKPITKYAVTVTDPKEIKYHLQKAIYLAKSGRQGPVWIDVPLDIQAAMIEESELSEYVPEDVPTDLSEPIKEVAKLISESERPVILAGDGIRLAGGYEAFMTLARRLGIPVMLTWRAADFMDEEDPLYYGRPGTSGQRGANLIFQNCDLLISIGARMDYGQIGFEHTTFSRNSKKIFVDIDPNELKKYLFKVDLPICADAKDFITALSTADVRVKDISSWKDKCRHWNDAYPTVKQEYFQVDDGVSTYALTECLAEHMGSDFVFAPSSSGASAEITMQSIRVRPGVRIINMPGLGSMGFCVPNALGVAVASGKKTVCITGDGGFEMNVQDLETIRRLGLPVTIFVLNNNGYGSIMTTQRNHFKGHFVASNPESGLSLPPLDKVADTFGFKYYKVESIKDVKDNISALLDSGKPVLCEVMVSKSEMTLPRVASKLGTDGKMHSQPLENMFPFLEESELDSEMIVPRLK